ncbi:unnamed protein product [Brassica napus]|uniref:(rape) hypothetical protein n=1 Tax=Brassica napus TaxID=3708 RepID=A0A816IAS6_BRANA|nr:unnamed protein product [Brassica napus]
MNRREVIVCRGIWYVMTLLSPLFGLSISLNLLWLPGGKSPASSRFLRDGAVSATTFYVKFGGNLSSIIVSLILLT